MSYVDDAMRRILPNCPTCDAWVGDPCRTPNNRTTKPHAARERATADRDTRIAGVLAEADEAREEKP